MAQLTQDSRNAVLWGAADFEALESAFENQTGLIPVPNYPATMDAAFDAMRTAQGLKDELTEDQRKSAMNSARKGALNDIAETLAGSTVLKVDGKEMSGADWYKNVLKGTSAKVYEFGEKMDAAIKEGKAEIVRRGVEFEIPAALKAGKRGRQKKDQFAALKAFIAARKAKAGNSETAPTAETQTAPQTAARGSSKKNQNK